MNIKELYNEIISKELPKHIGIIMDGNGRWAKKRGMPRTYGHHKGAVALYHLIEECVKLNIQYVTVYAFSTENWNRPKGEIDFIFRELYNFYDRYKEAVSENNVRVNIIGERSNFDSKMLSLIDRINNNSKDRTGLVLNVAFNYGSKKEIIHVMKEVALKVKNNEIKIDDINEELIENNLYTKGQPPVDLLIRTSGEERISNFMLWQIAYAEIYFTKTYWPAFGKKDLYLAIKEYQSRQRRFGGLK